MRRDVLLGRVNAAHRTAGSGLAMYRKVAISPYKSDSPVGLCRSQAARRARGQATAPRIFLNAISSTVSSCLACPVPCAKICRFRFSEIYDLVSPSRLAKRGGSRSSRTSGGMRWTRAARLTSALVCGRRSRVVLAPLCRCQVRKTPTRRADDGVNKAIGPRGERGRSRKTIAWGMPECFRCLAVNTGVHYLNSLMRTPGCGCIGHPAFPAPSV